MAHGSDYRSRQGRGYIADLLHDTPDYGEGDNNADDISLSSDDYNRENWYAPDSGMGGRPNDDNTVGQYGRRATQRDTAQARRLADRRPNDDRSIWVRVCTLLTDDDQLDAGGIEVAVSNGEVTLNGTVDDRRSKRLAEHLAEQTPGVLDIHNRIRIRRTEHRT